MKRTLALFLALLMALGLCACGGGDTPPTKEEMLENAETVTIDRLGEDFGNNIIAAKDTYVGKTFVIPGIVHQIKEDGCVLYHSKSTPPSAYFVKANIPVDELKNLNVGDIIHVVGTITDGVEKDESSPILGTTSTRNYITMENAHFVDNTFELSGMVLTHLYDGRTFNNYIRVTVTTEEAQIIALYGDVGGVTDGNQVTISGPGILEEASERWSDFAIHLRKGNVKVDVK